MPLGFFHDSGVEFCVCEPWLNRLYGLLTLEVTDWKVFVSLSGGIWGL